MKEHNLLSKFNRLTIWRRGGERAPHKPLLALYALGKAIRDEKRLVEFEEVSKNLIRLLNDFGPERKNHRPEYPFWRMQNDGIWEVKSPEQSEWNVNNSGDVKKSELIRYNAFGGFTKTVYREIKKNPTLFKKIVQKLLDDNFPPSIHEDILQAVGIDLAADADVVHRRNPEFRNRVLRAYEYRCAICGFDIRIDHTPIGLEAAHIKWHTAGGPDTETNGIALCALHHKLFDRGAFTLSDDMKIIVSDRANGSRGFKEWLMDFHGKTIKYPQRTAYIPHQDFTTWHVREVFHGQFRKF
jgi:putative restriction endonuclease